MEYALITIRKASRVFGAAEALKMLHAGRDHLTSVATVARVVGSEACMADAMRGVALLNNVISLTEGALT